MAKWFIRAKEGDIKNNSLGIPPAIVYIMQSRGIPEEKMEDFLSLRPKTAYDPFLLPDLKPAIDLILDAAAKDKRVCVYGDYDADGITATSVLVQVLSRIFKHFEYYIPCRFTDGYGLNTDAVKCIRNHGVDLLITVDCGSTSKDEVAYAKSLGMDVIVTDHHTPNEELEPDCLFVNAKRAGSEYPFPDLCGCGIAFKLAQGIQRTMNERGDERFSRKDLFPLLDMVAIATVADVVPLIDENRSLLKYGLEYINRRTNPGLRCLLNMLDCEDTVIDSDKIAYMLAPNINALGRMGTARIAAELFSGYKSDGTPAGELCGLASKMVESNRQRRSEQERAFEICENALKEEECGEYFPIICARGAHEGVTGIVAGNLKESLYRPVCIVTPCEDGTLKGTGRSIPGINLYDALDSCSQLFLRFGGHAGACGFSIMPENVPQLRAHLQEYVKKMAEETPELLCEKLCIEKELSCSEKNLEFAKTLALLEPFGEANERPVFCIMDAEVGCVRYMGCENQHLKFTARSHDGIWIDCVLFRRAPKYGPLLEKSRHVHIAGELSINHFNGCDKLQLVVRDIKGAD